MIDTQKEKRAAGMPRKRPVDPLKFGDEPFNVLLRTEVYNPQSSGPFWELGIFSRRPPCHVMTDLACSFENNVAGPPLSTLRLISSSIG